MKIAGLDIGFSTTRPSAGIGIFDGKTIQLSNCFGVDACNLLIKSGNCDIIAVDRPIVPNGTAASKPRGVERLFSTGLFQKRCKPGMSHVPTTGVRFREETGKAADLLLSSLKREDHTSLFPRVRHSAIIEAFPNAFLSVCLDDNVFAAIPSLRRSKKFDWLYDQWKDKRLLRKLPGLTATQRNTFEAVFDKTDHHDHRAALICVLTGLTTARGHFTAIGNVDSGWFFLPQWSFWSPWAKHAVGAGMKALTEQGVQIEIVRSDK